jgi:hypothetical protein
MKRSIFRRTGRLRQPASYPMGTVSYFDLRGVFISRHDKVWMCREILCVSTTSVTSVTLSFAHVTYGYVSYALHSTYYCQQPLNSTLVWSFLSNLAFIHSVSPSSLLSPPSSLLPARASIPLCLYASTSMPFCCSASMPLYHYTTIPPCLYAAIPLKLYPSIPLYPYPSMPLHCYASMPLSCLRPPAGRLRNV